MLREHDWQRLHGEGKTCKLAWVSGLIAKWACGRQGRGKVE